MQIRKGVSYGKYTGTGKHLKIISKIEFLIR